MQRCCYETLKIGEPKRYYFYVVLGTVFYNFTNLIDLEFCPLEMRT